MKRFILSVVALAIVLLPATVTAQLAPVPNPVEYLDYLYGSGVNGNNGSPSQVGPYAGRFLTGPGGSPTSGTFSLYCVDHLNTVSDQWVAATALGTGQIDGNLTATRLGATAGAVSKYTRAAYLASLFDSWSYYATLYSTDKQTVWSAMHSAIWSIVSGTTVANPGFTLRDTFMGMANTAYAGGYQADGWYVLSPISPDNGQEFLIRTNVVPEPSTYIMLATGLLFLVAFGRKRLGVRGGGSTLA